MKKIISIGAILLLLVSCQTTNNFYYEETENGFIYKTSNEYVEASYKPNYSVIAFDIFGRPFLYTWLVVRETGRVFFYANSNVVVGILKSMDTLYDNKESFGDQYFLPDKEKIKEEREKLRNDYESSNFYIYREYTDRWAYTTLEVESINETVIKVGDIIYSSGSTLYLYDTVEDTVYRLSTKASLIGKEASAIVTPIVAFPFFAIGCFIGFLSH